MIIPSILLIVLPVIFIVIYKLGDFTGKQIICLCIIALYLEIVLLLTLVLRQAYAGTHIKLFPFWLFFELDHYGLEHVLREVLINIMMFFPVGLVLRIGFPFLKLVIYILIGFGLSLLIESLQIILRVGAFEITDIVLNISGIILGYLTGLLVLNDNRQ